MASETEQLAWIWGEPFRAATGLPSTLGEAFRRASGDSSDGDLIYVDREGAASRQSLGTLANEARRILAGLRAAGLRAGDRVILQLERNEDLLPAFWGCVLGGVVPVLAPRPPAYDQPSRGLEQLVHLCRLLSPCTIVTCDASVPAVHGLTDSRSSDGPLVLGLDALRCHAPDAEPWPGEPDAPALFALTSGSTSMPKCVVLTHRNLLARAAGANELCRHSPDDVVLNWLPFDHIGSISDWHLRCVLLGCRMVYAPKEYVLSQPLRWLELIEQYRVTHTWAPNFAYGLVNDLLAKAEQRPWDLTSVEAFLTAGEAVSAGVSERFAALLAPCGLRPTVFRPAFGMAEMGSGVTYSLGTPESPLRAFRARRASLGGMLQPAETNDPSAVTFVSLGPPIPGMSLRIVDGEGHVLPEQTVGHFQVRGEAVSRGYYRAPEANRAFHDDGWFETGDLGFLLDGELYLTGRAKDSIIVNGANYGCSEIEELVESASGVEPSFTAACAVRRQDSAQERLVIFFHAANAEDGALPALLREIRGKVARRIGIRPDYLVPVAKEAIPKTAIGKLQRSALVRRFEAGEFDAILDRVERLESAERTLTAAGHDTPRESGPHGDIERRLAAIWEEVLNLPQVGLNENIFELGGNSVLLVQLHARIEAAFGPRLSVVDIFQYPTIAAQSRLLAAPADGSGVPAPALRGRQRAEARRRGNAAPLGNSGVAVIGMACRFPGAADVAQFWRNLAGGVESISFFTPEQVLSTGVDPELVRHPSYVRAAPVLDGIDQFDAEFFGYTTREAELMDPQQRLLLECAWEAVEDAGYSPRACPGAVGVFVSGLLNTYLLNNLYPAGAYREGDASRVMTLNSTGGFQVMVASDKDYLPTRISYKLNLRGPSVNVQTACSSSLVAIHTAVESLLRGECDMALAGGASVSVPQEAGYLYQEGLLVSPDGHCRAFDARAQGTIFGNGAGLVLLKRLDDALADGDPIYAVVRGSAVNNDGGEKAGYMAPSQDGQAAVVAEALAAAGVSAETISYVEAHGTGTALGDPIEIAGLTQAFRGDTAASGYCAVGSVKTNVGHLQIASGIAGFIKTVLLLHHRQFVPSLHFTAPNPRIDFAGSPFYVNTAFCDWPETKHPRRASVNSLGIGGTNVHVILEESPHATRPAPAAERPCHLLTLSAKTPEALRELAGRIAARLDTVDDLKEPSLADVAFTANTGRAHFPERLAVVAKSLPQLRSELDRIAWDRLPECPSRQAGNLSHDRPRVAFLFAGRETDLLDAGREMYRSSPSFRGWIDRCDTIVQPILSRSLLNVLHADPRADRPEEAAAALLAVEWSLARLWMSWGIVPAVVMGRDLGQYAAACVAGMITLEDALRLVVHRAGLSDASDEASIGSFGDVTAGVSYHPARLSMLPLAVGATAQDVSSAAAEHGCSVLLEMGFPSPASGEGGERSEPGEGGWKPVETAMLQAAPLTPGPSPASGRGEQDLPSPETSEGRAQGIWAKMLSSLAALYVRGAAVDWTGFDRDYPRRRISLATYPFQRKRYWIDRPREAFSGSPADEPADGLLGRQFRSPALRDAVFESRVGVAAMPILDDHRFHDTPVLPGAFQLATVAEAATRLGMQSGWAIEDVAFAEALATPDGTQRAVQWIFAAAEDSRRPFQLVSRPTDAADDAPWTVHTTGRLVPAAGQLDVLPPDVLQSRERLSASARTVSADEFYATMRAHQVRLGLKLQAIERAWVGEGEVLCQVNIPPALAQSHDALAGAVLLDACVQVLGGFESYPAGLTRMPTAVKRFRWFRHASGQPLWCHVRIARGESAVAGQWTVDAWLFESDGRPVAEFTGLQLVEVPRDTLMQALGKRELDWLYRPVWVRQTAGRSCTPSDEEGKTRELDGVQLRPTDRSWLILADGGGFGERLAAELQARGASCDVVRLEELDVSSPDHFQKAIDAAWDVSTGAPRGIVYLGPLDQADADDAWPGLRLGCASLLHLFQAVGEPDLRFCLVTRGAQSVDGLPGPVRAEAAALWGFCRTAALEYPEMSCLRVDLDPQASEGEVARLADELLSDGAEPEAALRGADRYVARLRRHAPDGSTPVTIRGDATYLVTGGAGGLGLHVAEWLVEQGARHVVLASRGGASSDAARGAVERWRQRGIDVHVARADVASEGELAALLSHVHSQMPPLAGIIHAAGTRADGTLRTLTREQFDTVLAAKALGAWNLHRLTRELPLDFFVGFSSIASLLGSAGQANYAAANAFLDGLIEQRRSQGLAGLSIHWGPWKGEGMWATLSSADRQALARRGLEPLEPEAAVGALPALLGDRAARVAAVQVDWVSYLRETAGAPAALLEELTAARQEQAEDHARVRIHLQQAAPSERKRLLAEHVHAVIINLLGADGEGPLDLQQGFYDLGFDSLSILMLRSRLQSDLGLKLPATIAFKFNTVALLVDHLAEALGLTAAVEEPAVEEPAVTARQQPAEPAKDLDQLSMSDLADRLAAKLAAIRSGHGKS